MIGAASSTDTTPSAQAFITSRLVRRSRARWAGRKIGRKMLVSSGSRTIFTKGKRRYRDDAAAYELKMVVLVRLMGEGGDLHGWHALWSASGLTKVSHDAEWIAQPSPTGSRLGQISGRIVAPSCKRAIKIDEYDAKTGPAQIGRPVIPQKRRVWPPTWMSLRHSTRMYPIIIRTWYWYKRGE